MSAARVDHKQSIRRAINPECEISAESLCTPSANSEGVADLENRVRLEQRSGKKKPEECQEPRRQEPR